MVAILWLQTGVLLLGLLARPALLKWLAFACGCFVVTNAAPGLALTGIVGLGAHGEGLPHLALSAVQLPLALWQLALLWRDLGCGAPRCGVAWPSQTRPRRQ